MKDAVGEMRVKGAAFYSETVAHRAAKGIAVAVCAAERVAPEAGGANSSPQLRLPNLAPGERGATGTPWDRQSAQ
jgi:hypothetical protein